MSTETKFVVDIALSLTIAELQDLRKLADARKSTVPETVRFCMNTKCKELLSAPVVIDVQEEVKIEPDTGVNS